jgi:ATP-dependent 26S proteasome regulatory subunit
MMTRRRCGRRATRGARAPAIRQKELSAAASLEPAIDNARIAGRYEMSCGIIMNMIGEAALQAISRDERVLRHQDFLDAVRREYAKESASDG